MSMKPAWAIWGPALFLGFMALPLRAELLWQTQPPGGPQNSDQHDQNGGGHASHRGAPSLYLRDAAEAETTIWSSTLERLELPIEARGKAAIPRTGVDNYHALVANRQEGKLHESAVRYLYRRGKPSGHSPSELTGLEKLPLEIVPDPLPREHRRYTGDREERFLIRYRGEPLSGVWVGLETTHGSQLEAVTNTEGRARFVIPDDFPRVVPGRRNNPPAEMVVRAGYTDDGTLYRTNLSAPYYTNPSNWNSFGAGLFMLGAGFLAGVMIMRRSAVQKGGRA